MDIFFVMHIVSNGRYDFLPLILNFIFIVYVFDFHFKPMSRFVQIVYLQNIFICHKQGIPK